MEPEKLTVGKIEFQPLLNSIPQPPTWKGPLMLTPEFETYLRVLEAAISSGQVSLRQPEADLIACVNLAHKAVEAWERGRR
jgi:hypothetical protein